MRFDGTQASQIILANLRVKIGIEGVYPEIATILIGKDEASELYTKLKKRAAEKIGVKMHVFRFNEGEFVSNIKRQINNLKRDKNVDGVMIQLPIPGKLSKYKDELIDLIDEEKDIDGMKPNSKFTPATVKGITNILDIAKKGGFIGKNSKIAVVGSEGEVGRALVSSSQLTVHGKFDLRNDLKNLKNFDVIISATGQANLIKPKMIKEGSVLIDVGAPSPEFDPECYEKALFYTPVPGGVGPMTIASLMQNVVDACY